MKNAYRVLPTFLLSTAVLGGCGGEEPTPSTREGVLESALQAEGPADAEGVTAMAYCDDVISWPSAWTSYENEVLNLVNQRRAAGAYCGGVWRAPVPALSLDSRLRCAARKHSKDMGVNNFFSHTGSNGSSPWQRITWAGYTYSYAGENIAAGYSTPSAVVTGWMNSTGHCDNIMSSRFVHLGVGYYYASGSTYGHYWTQDFGRP